MYSTTHVKFVLYVGSIGRMYEQKTDIECGLEWNWAVAKLWKRGTECICDWEKTVKKWIEREEKNWKVETMDTKCENVLWNGQFLSTMQIGK